MGSAATPFVPLVLGLLIAGWGHCVIHDVRGIAAAWERLDAAIPSLSRMPADVAGVALLLEGIVCVALALLLS